MERINKTLDRSCGLCLILSQKNELQLSFLYDRNQYLEADIQSLQKQYLHLLSELIRLPNEFIKNISILTPAEYQKMVIDWNITGDNYSCDKTIHQLFEAHVIINPEKTALSYHNQTLSYLQLNRKANQLSHYLQRVSERNERPIALCFEHSFNQLISLMAVLKTGLHYIAINPHDPDDRLQLIIDDANVQLILSQELFAPRFKNLKGNVIIIENEADRLADFPDTNPELKIAISQTAYIIYTSGSTGKPKGVITTHKNIIFFLHWFEKKLNLTEEDVFEYSSPLSFDISLPNTLLPLTIGSKIAILSKSSKKDPELFINDVIKNQVTSILVTPSYFAQLAELAVLSNLPLPFLKYICLGGEAVQGKDIEKWLQKYPEHIFFNMYGPTETTGAITSFEITTHNKACLKGNIPIGRPAENSKLYILNRDLQPLPIGLTGELYIGGSVIPPKNN